MSPANLKKIANLELEISKINLILVRKRGMNKRERERLYSMTIRNIKKLSEK